MSEPASPLRGQVRSRAWKPVSHGLYRLAGGDDEAWRDLEAWQLVLPPSGVFSHLTAASAYGWWTPPLPVDLPVFAAVSDPDPRPRRGGLRVSRHPRPIAWRQVRDVRLATPAEALLACACDLRLLDIIVLVDAALHCGDCTVSDIVDLVGQRRRGSPLLRRALAMADARSESAWETLLRVLHVTCAVPVRPQFVVLDEAGAFVARGDLLLEGTKTLHEYDGAQHRTKPRHRTDLARERRIGNAVWTRRGYTDLEVLTKSVMILRDADRSLGRPHRPERIRPWHALLSESMFTASGRTQVRSRLGLPQRGTGHRMHGSGPKPCIS